MSMYYPEGVKDINYKSVIRPTIMPNIIISITLNKVSPGKYKVVSSKYFATKDPLSLISRKFATKNSGFSILPFTNVYESAEMCFGSAARVINFKLPDLKNIHSYYQVLFDSAFNDDLGLLGLNRTWRERPISKWYDHLASLAKDGKSFPYSELITT